MRYKTNRTESSPPRVRCVKPAEVRLSELMSAAEQLFLAKGVDSTTINEIVEQAQVAKGTFYHYFASKNELLSAMRERYTDQFLKRLEEKTGTCKADDYLGQLCAWVRESIEAYVDTYRLHDIVYTNHHHHNRTNWEKNAILEQLQVILENGTRVGVWQVSEARITSLIIYSGVYGATDDIIASSEIDRDHFISAVLVNCLQMVGVLEYQK
ncbi:TetR/AcrR family transcriptional regulator [Salinivibrio costicola]|uniref:TetR/AcrR family transcriptional regulator n=2 Tax=Vibrionaceae TaxID=641 RepID=A0ABX6K7Y0_SALCS|nr:TetR family transcriptional regulator [Salinivibrio sp. DV]QIR07627.1 TetR/AcrR family transcriptional regulator [Salinivibrio costicola]